MAIDEQENAAVEITEIHASHSEESVIAVIRNVDALHALQRVGQGPRAITFEIVRCEHADGRGGFGDFLFEFGCGVNAGHWNLHQLFKTEFGQIGRRRDLDFRALAGRNRQKHERQSALENHRTHASQKTEPEEGCAIL